MIEPTHRAPRTGVGTTWLTQEQVPSGPSHRLASLSRPRLAPKPRPAIGHATALGAVSTGAAQPLRQATSWLPAGCSSRQAISDIADKRMHSLRNWLLYSNHGARRQYECQRKDSLLPSAFAHPQQLPAREGIIPFCGAQPLIQPPKAAVDTPKQHPSFRHL